MPRRKIVHGTVPAKPSDRPNPEILIREFHVYVRVEEVQAVIEFTPFVNGVALPNERRHKLFSLQTPFIDILEDVPNLYTSWENYPYFIFRKDN